MSDVTENADSPTQDAASARAQVALDFDRLVSLEPAIPWDQLHAFAEAVAAEADADGEVTGRLLRVYEEVWSRDFSASSFEMLYVPAIFQIAAPRLPAEVRRRLAAFFVAQLKIASESASEIDEEVLGICLGCLGDPAVAAALDRLEIAVIGPDDYPPDWRPLTRVLEYVGLSQDESLRRRASDYCRQTIQAGIDGRVDTDTASTLAALFVALGAPDARDLISRALEEARKLHMLHSGESMYLAAMAFIDNPNPDHPPIELHDRPVDKWLPIYVEECKQWYEQGMKDEEEWLAAKASLLNDPFSAGMDPADQSYYEPPPPQSLKEPQVGNLVLQPDGRYVRQGAKVGRNDPCPCGSEKKYKKCCGKHA